LCFANTAGAQCENLFNVTTTRTYDASTDKTTYIFAVTNVGSKYALSHWSLTYDFCPGQEPVFLNGAMISYSINGVNYTSLGTPQFKPDPSQDCYTGPVLKFDFGRGGIGTTTYYKLVVNGYWAGNFSSVIYKYATLCCTQPYPGPRVCLQEPGPPILTCPPGVLALACNQALPAPDPASVVVLSDCPDGFVVSFVSDVLVSTVGCLQTWTRTYRAADRCGGVTTCTQTITRPFDTEKPVINLTPASTVPLPCNPTTAQIEAVFGTVSSVTDNCSTGLTATGSVGQESGTGCTRSVTKTWTVTDNCGNTQSATQTVTFTRDTEKPVITVGALGAALPFKNTLGE
jgi:hypothetical protein